MSNELYIDFSFRHKLYAQNVFSLPHLDQAGDARIQDILGDETRSHHQQRKTLASD